MVWASLVAEQKEVGAAMEVSPSKVRIRALQEYESLRRTVDELDGVAARLLAVGSDPTATVGAALAVAAKLLHELSDYVDLERLFVLPTVRRVDIWGCIRADTLTRDHTAQQNGLRAIERDHHHSVDPPLLAADLRLFVHSLRETLEREEREVLGSDALRDDVVDTEPD
jgi:hypothetical protein